MQSDDYKRKASKPAKRKPRKPGTKMRYMLGQDELDYLYTQKRKAKRRSGIIKHKRRDNDERFDDGRRPKHKHHRPAHKGGL